jgi:urate oxidase
VGFTVALRSTVRVHTVLGDNRYGKAGIRLVRVERATPRHEIRDLTVDVALAGDLTEVHTSGDNTNVVATDTQKNTVYAFARDGIGAVEGFALRLARHFVTRPAIARARVRIREHGWRRLDDHSFVRTQGARFASAWVADGRESVVSGVSDLTVLKSTGSEFRGFDRDRYTTLAETTDRILATDIHARWRFAAPATDWDADRDADWDASHEAAREALLAAFAGTYSRSLQQTLYAMGQAVLRARPELCEARLSLPNKHHFLVDLAPFGLDNPGEVFHAADRPYGLIEGTVLREDAPSEVEGHDW